MYSRRNFFSSGLRSRADRAARVHVVVGVEVVLEHAEHAILLLADVALEPGREHLADAVVVAHGRAGALDRVKDRGVVGLEGVLILHTGEEDEIQVRALPDSSATYAS